MPSALHVCKPITQKEEMIVRLASKVLTQKTGKAKQNIVFAKKHRPIPHLGLQDN